MGWFQLKASNKGISHIIKINKCCLEKFKCGIILWMLSAPGQTTDRTAEMDAE